MDLRSQAKFALSTVILLLMPCFAFFSAQAQSGPLPGSVEVYWKSARAVSAPGVTSVVLLDESIAQAQVGVDSIRFVGLERGETVALAYVNGTPISMVVRVVYRNVEAISPSLLRRDSELAHGVYGSDVQVSGSPAGHSWQGLDTFDMSQRVAGNNLRIAAQVEDNSPVGGHSANLRNGAISWESPGLTLSAADYLQSVSGANYEDRATLYSSTESVQLRGASTQMRRGGNEYSVFAGTTIPYYFLSLRGTSDAVGFTFRHKFSDRLTFYSGTTYTNVPQTFSLLTTVARINGISQTAGTRYRLSKSLIASGLAGVSNRGSFIRGDVGYTTYRLAAYGSVEKGSLNYPLNRLQSLFSSSSSVRGNFLYRFNQHLTAATYVERSTIAAGLLAALPGVAQTFTTNLGYRFNSCENLSFYYSRSSSSGGFTANTSTGNRFDFSLSSQIRPRITNTAEVTVGSLQDPLQINSEDQFTIRDSISVPFYGGSLVASFDQDRVQPSLLQKLSQEVNLLSPELQALFAADPVNFLNSPSFPPQIKALLLGEQPVGTSFSLSGNFGMWGRLRISPMVSVTHANSLNNTDTWAETYGYSLVYQMRPTLQIRSFLSNALLLNSQQTGLQRTSILSVGFQKSFSAHPNFFLPAHHERAISGRVFRDGNVNGAYNSGEQGLEGLVVRLDGTESAVTDAQGRYRFPGVSAEQHTITLDLTQFQNPIRMTTKNSFEADLIQERSAVLNFGIVDFARVMGNVFNDLHLDNSRQPEARGVRGVSLVIENEKNRYQALTDGAGDYELSSVEPGDYRLSIDASTLPPNFILPAESRTVHVSPVSTVVTDVPVRALRSISGKVVLKTLKSGAASSSTDQLGIGGIPGSTDRKAGNGRNKRQETPSPEYVTVPLAGVQITADHTTVTTDKDGVFLLRNLPAGELTVRLVPIKDVPEGLAIPTGKIVMQAEPTAIEGATIVIGNPALVPYLTTTQPQLPQ